MMEISERRCPCWHTIYSREVGQYREATDPHCSACKGTGRARFVTFTDPRNVVRLDPPVLDEAVGA